MLHHAPNCPTSDTENSNVTQPAGSASTANPGRPRSTKARVSATNPPKTVAVPPRSSTVTGTGCSIVSMKYDQNRSPLPHHARNPAKNAVAAATRGAINSTGSGARNTKPGNGCRPVPKYHSTADTRI